MHQEFFHLGSPKCCQLPPDKEELLRQPLSMPPSSPLGRAAGGTTTTSSGWVLMSILGALKPRRASPGCSQHCRQHGCEIGLRRMDLVHSEMGNVQVTLSQLGQHANEKKPLMFPLSHGFPPAASILTHQDPGAKEGWQRQGFGSEQEEQIPLQVRARAASRTTSAVTRA